MVGAIGANFIVDLAAKGLGHIEPALAPILLVGQILVALGTVVWIIFKIRGTRLDNALKQAELDAGEARKNDRASERDWRQERESREAREDREDKRDRRK